jgi:hypothetical protein
MRSEVVKKENTNETKHHPMIKQPVPTQKRSTQVHRDLQISTDLETFSYSKRVMQISTDLIRGQRI